MTSNVDQLGRFRPYLRFLARVSWDSRLQAKFDPSDLVQQTLLQAHQNLHQFQGTSDAELAGWLRQILANVVAERQRHYRRDKRDLMRERSLRQDLDESSRRMAAFVSSDPTPSKQVEFNEGALRLAAAIERLPEDQRQALVLHYWEGLPISEVAQIIGRSHSAVGGLVHRGLKSLRLALADLR